MNHPQKLTDEDTAENSCPNNSENKRKATYKRLFVHGR